MNEQLNLIEQALKRAQGASLGAMPLDISVSRQYGDSTVTMRTQMPAGTAGVAQPPMLGALGQATQAPSIPQPAAAPEGIGRTATRLSFYEGGQRPELAAEGGMGTGEDNSVIVNQLLTEIERLKRKALSRGVNLTSPHEDVPAEDVAMLRQVFQLADSQGAGRIDKQDFGNLHFVLGEPLANEELSMAFKAMDTDKSGSISFDEFLAWYALAHSNSGMLSKKGEAYTRRFKKIMAKLEEQFELKNLTVTTSGQPHSLEYRVQFHYNDRGQLKQISPWHDIPLYSVDGYVHLITEIPKFSRAKFEIATGEPLNPIKQDTKNGKLREYKYGDMLFNYGAFPQTWEDPKHTTPDTGFVGDNDPIDAVEIGVRRLFTGSVTKVKVLGVLAMIDDGETDWKVICINVDDVLAPDIDNLGDVERVMPGTVDVLREWLRKYKTVDGKPENQFGLEERALDREYALTVINETHSFWKALTRDGTTTV
jgi:inorganic pyrophosphatase